MPLTFLLLSLPISVGVFVLVFGFAVFHELLVADSARVPA